MAALLITVGYFVGETYNPDGGGVLGVLVAVCIWTFMSLISYYAGDSIILLSSRAHEVSKEVHPQLYNVVEEMKIAANLHAMPKIYIIDEVAPNAFATGRNPKSSSIAVTAGLLNRLNRDELQGVVAHEMSHIMNRDVMFVTFAGVLVGSIVLLSDVFLRSLWFGGSSRRYRSGKGVKGGSNPTIMIIAIVLTIISPNIAQLLYFAISRKREYLADASAARLTRYPEGLASALEEIADNNIELVSANKITAPMYIVNPMVLKEGMRLADLSSTHPPISERIAILRKMAGGADYEHYQRAFGAVKGKRYSIIPPSGIRTSTNIPIRQPSEAKKKDRTKKQQQRDLGDLMRAINQYLFLVCACGLKIKIPPDFKEDKITCPKCSRVLEVPLGQLTAATAAMAAGAGSTDQRTLHVQEEEMQTYNRIGDGWETVVCKCGMPNQLSPAFRGAHITCRNCNRRIIIQR
ncbi:M48 family metallopeptidase [bacterium]|nr:M48 family metallopeptidase [bacterium]